MRVPLALLSLLALGCAGRDDPDAWSQRDSSGVAIVENVRPRFDDWRLDDATALELSGGTLPTDPVSLAVDRAGRILVTDRGAQGGGAVLVYDREGRFVRRVGGEAGVPGALQQPQWAQAYLGDSVAAFDFASKKIVIFSGDGVFAREAAIPIWLREGAYGVPPFTAGAVGAMEDGHFLTYARGALDRLAVEGPAWYRHELVRVHPSGERWDTLGTFEIFQTWLAPESTMPYPYGPVAQRAAYGSGFLFGSAERFEVQEHDSTGALRRIVRRGRAPSPVNEADIALYRDWFLSRARAGGADSTVLARLAEQLRDPRHPDRRPAISNLIVDDERNVWVESFRWVDSSELAPAARPTPWSVFNPEGRWLADVEVPAGFLLGAVGHNRVYGFAVDASGARTVRAYEIVH